MLGGEDKERQESLQGAWCHQDQYWRLCQICNSTGEQIVGINWGCQEDFGESFYEGKPLNLIRSDLGLILQMQLQFTLTITIIQVNVVNQVLLTNIFLIISPNL